MNFEQRLYSLLAELNGKGSEVKVFEATGAFLVLGNYKVDSLHRSSIIAAESPKETNLSPCSTLEYFMKCVEYETVSSVLRHFEQTTRPASNRSAYDATSDNQ